MKNLLTLLLCCICATAKAQYFDKLKPAKDSTYGYSMEQPLLMKVGNPYVSITHTKEFIKVLRTTNDEPLQIISRGSHFNGEIMIDNYTLVTPSAKDTVSLYVDIYHKGKLRIPVGLKVQE